MPRVVRIEGAKRPTYKLIAFLGADSNGKKKTKSTTFKEFDPAISVKQQERLAMQKAVEFEDRLKNGVCFDGNKVSFEEYSRMWLEDMERKLVYTSYTSYKRIVEDSLIPYFGHMKMAKIKLSMIEDFYKTLTPKYSQSSIMRYVHVLNGIFKMGVRREMIERNPCVGAEVSKSAKKTEALKFFTPEQSIAFLASLDLKFEWEYKGHKRVDDTGKPYYVNSYTEHRDMPTQLKVFYHIALFCGLRKGEILALHWNDIELDKHVLHVSKTAAKSKDGLICKEPKTKNSVRTVPIPKQVVPLLLQYQSEYEAYRSSLGDKWQGQGNLFVQADGRLMDLSTPYERFKSHIEKYNEWAKQENENLPAGQKKHVLLPNIPLHGLRHSCATLLNSLDVNILAISSILGHAQTSTTMNIYAHSFEKKNWEACLKMEEFLEENKVFAG